MFMKKKGKVSKIRNRHFSLFQKKKGQGLSMNVIIVAALALLVLVILSVVFTSKMRDTRQNIDACESNNGICYDPSIDPEACSGTYDKKNAPFVCKQNDGNSGPYECCLKG